MALEYLLKKIESVKWDRTPFKHIQIKNFLKTHHFKEIINDKRLVIEKAQSDRELCAMLESKGYKPSWLPGSTSNIEQYLDYREGKNNSLSRNPTCEATGIAYKLSTKQNEDKGLLLEELLQIMESDDFWNRIMQKTKVKTADYTRYVAYTKYLDGHEISPHTDSRHKPITFLLNLNPPNLKLDKENHTALMKLKKEYKYIIDYWKHNKSVDRCWLPWEWAETYKYHSENNSLLIIPASDKSFHSIKLKYNHLKAQRSMIYGSIWNTKEKVYDCPLWHDLEIKSSNKRLINATTCNQWKND